jgi:hypothetical protein
VYIAPGTLDQRIRIYQRQDVGADGFQRPVYVFVEERWGRIDESASRQNVSMSPQAHVEARSDATLTCAEDVAVDPFGVVRVANGTILYWVRGTFKARQVRAQQVTLERVTPEQWVALEVYESDEVLDGVHLIEPA